MRTKRDGIMEASLKGERLRCLMAHFTEGNLTRCFNKLDARKAIGIDQVTKDIYGTDLQENIAGLVTRLKSMSYRPQPSRLVKIPKSEGKERSLAISCVEDKIVQMLTKELLDAVYEPIFSDCSYGFRKGRGCHDAVKSLRSVLYTRREWKVLDIDLQNYFGEIPHNKLISILGMKISDQRFLRYISRMLKSGIMSKEGIRYSTEGSPQGSICSPVLANIYAHYCIDSWFENEVKPRLQGRGEIIRYADDFCVCLSLPREVDKVMRSLKLRLNRFGLSLSEAKSSIVSLDTRFHRDDNQTLKFLGFEFFLGKCRKGRALIKVKTSGKALRSGLNRLTEWIKRTRNRLKLRALWQIYLSKMSGHINYFSVSDNARSIQKFNSAATKIFFKWVNRRSQKKSFSWSKFSQFMNAFPPPILRTVHRLY